MNKLLARKKAPERSFVQEALQKVLTTQPKFTQALGVYAIRYFGSTENLLCPQCIQDREMDAGLPAKNSPLYCQKCIDSMAEFAKEWKAQLSQADKVLAVGKAFGGPNPNSPYMPTGRVVKTEDSPDEDVIPQSFPDATSLVSKSQTTSISAEKSSEESSVCSRDLSPLNATETALSKPESCQYGSKKQVASSKSRQQKSARAGSKASNATTRDKPNASTNASALDDEVWDASPPVEVGVMQLTNVARAAGSTMSAEGSSFSPSLSSTILAKSHRELSTSQQSNNDTGEDWKSKLQAVLDEYADDVVRTSRAQKDVLEREYRQRKAKLSNEINHLDQQIRKYSNSMHRLGKDIEERQKQHECLTEARDDAVTAKSAVESVEMKLEQRYKRQMSDLEENMASSQVKLQKRR